MAGGLVISEIISSPWQELFVELLRKAKSEVYLAGPFIKEQSARVVLDNMNNNVDFRYINSFKLANFYRGASDLSALELFNKNQVKQKNIQNLHAKFYILDDKAIVTSGNLTPGGLRNNIECGLLVDGETAGALKQYYLDLFNAENYPMITGEIIQKAKQIIDAAPKIKPEISLSSENSLFNEVLNDENYEECFNGGLDAIVANLSLWKKDVFIHLTKINKNIFDSNDVYGFANELQLKHPDNKNIKPKIRQQLQYLRDLGLLEFIKPGVYKKLWS